MSGQAVGLVLKAVYVRLQDLIRITFSKKNLPLFSDLFSLDRWSVMRVFYVDQH
jgi:hypothetical protein